MRQGEGPRARQQGVSINGVVWATRNVDIPTFAAKPESSGVFYKWNRNNTGDTWMPANDPSPAGWRVPTIEEIITLLDKDKVDSEWTTLNGVSGQKFMDKTSGASIFFPAAGRLQPTSGELAGAGIDGGYWSSSVDSPGYAQSLNFFSYAAVLGSYTRALGFSVRCVRK